MSNLKTDFVERVFGVKFKDFHFETPRRKELRLELATRHSIVTDVFAKRLTELTKASHKGSQRIAKANKTQTAMDLALRSEDLASDTVETSVFNLAATQAGLSIDAATKLSQEMEAETKELVKKAKRRDSLTKQFEDKLALIGEDLSVIRKQIPPGELDTDLRDEQNKVYKQLNVPAFARPTDVVSFDLADSAVVNALKDFEKKADELLKPELKRAATFTTLDEADLAAEEASKSASLFGEECSELVKDLEKLRTRLQVAKEVKIIEEIGQAADEAKLRAPTIGQAGQVASELIPKIEKATKEADEPPAKTLQNAWDLAVSKAREQLKTAKTAPLATETLKAVSTKLRETEELTEAVAKLRERAKLWEEKRKSLESLISTAESKLLEPATKLITSIKSKLSTIGSLDSDFAKQEEALHTIDIAVKEFQKRGETLRENVKVLKPVKGWKQSPSLILGKRIDTSLSDRKREPSKAVLILNGVEETLPKIAELCRVLEELGNLKSDQLSSLVARSENKVMKAEGFDDLLNEATLELDKVKSIKAFNSKLAPYSDRINSLKSSKTAAIAKYVKEKVSQGATKAGELNGKDAALQLLDEVIQRLPAMEKFSSTAESTMTQARNLLKTLPGPLNKVFTTLLNSKIPPLIKSEHYVDAMVHVESLEELIRGALVYKSAYETAEGLLVAVKALKPSATKNENVKANESFSLRLNAVLDGTAKNLTEITQDLLRLKIDLETEKLNRQNATREALGGKKDDPRLAAIFSDSETVEAVMALAEEIGEAELKRLIASLGMDGKSVPQDLPEKDIGKAVAKALKELKALGGGKLKSLSDTLGGIEKVAGFCDETGSASLAVNLYTEFASDLPKLGTLVKDGFGDDPKRVRAILGGGGQGAKRAKQLSDGFVNRTELKTLIDNVRSDLTPEADLDDDQLNAQAAKILGNVVANNFSSIDSQSKKTEDWGKLKSPFFDTLSTQTDSVRLMQKAANFKHKATGEDRGPWDYLAVEGVSGGLRMGHVLTRHTPEHFKMDSIDTSNTQFPIGTSEATIIDLVETTLGSTDIHGDSISDEISKLGVDQFKAFWVNLPAKGLQVKIGIVNGKIDQFFPVVGLGTNPMLLDDFDNTQMNAIKGALGK